jgi:A/G-specific adenine glycosylase
MTEALLIWYSQNKRALPWRNTRDPYKIWLSEIILQQTRVAQGLPYYHKFIERFPTVQALAQALENEVLLCWQGLGYYSRARNLHATAKYVSQQLQGAFPASYSDLLALKGIGEYTAAAIASFCFELEHAVLDGNVFRVISRYFGIQEPIDIPATKKKIQLLLSELIQGTKPSTFNQAMMEFGALQCVPANPNCSICPLQLGCEAFRQNKVQELPIKSKKTNVTARYFDYFKIYSDAYFPIQQRMEKDIWHKLFELPLISHQQQVGTAALIQSDAFKNLFPIPPANITFVHQKKHVLSHQHIYARFWEVEDPSFLERNRGKYLFIKDEEIMNFAFPRLLENFFEK